MEQKNRDVEALSEHTLTVLDTSRVNNLKLCGINIETPSVIIEQFAKALAEGDQSMPANVLFVGPPGTGKTDLAILTGHLAKVAAYQMLSPKGGIVGETERKANLQQSVLCAWSPNIAFVDEITESFPLERTDFNGDSGASRAVMAALLTALSDETRRGSSLLIATTNCPWRMGAAMRSRFIIIPVLHPLKDDFPKIIIAIVKHIESNIKLNDKDPKIVEASKIFYEKGANPRHIRSSLNKALLESGKLIPDTIIIAADDLCHSTDFHSVIYTDLWAIKACSFKSFLPWNNNLDKYQFPNHLKEIVNPVTGEINDQELNKQINEMKSYANV